jgi:hypothetical protein
VNSFFIAVDFSQRVKMVYRNAALAEIGKFVLAKPIDYYSLTRPDQRSGRQ